MSCDSWEVSKSKKVHQPDSNDESSKVKLGYIVETDQIDGKKHAKDRHEFVVSKLVNQEAWHKSRQAVNNSTEIN